MQCSEEAGSGADWRPTFDPVAAKKMVADAYTRFKAVSAAATAAGYEDRQNRGCRYMRTEWAHPPDCDPCRKCGACRLWKRCGDVYDARLAAEQRRAAAGRPAKRRASPDASPSFTVPLHMPSK